MSAAEDLVKWAKAKKRNWDVIGRGPGIVQRKAGVNRLGAEEYDSARELTRRGDVKGLKDLIKSVRNNPFNR